MSANAKLFMKLTGVSSGEIKGESEAETFEGQIEIDDWKWGLGRNSNAAELTEIGSSIPPPPNSVEPSVFSFSKLMDRSTTGMLSAMRSGELMTAVITLEEAADVDFELTITLTRARVLSYSLNSRDSEKSGSVEEEWTFNYEIIRFDYMGTRSAGKVTFQRARPPGSSNTPQSSKTEEMRKLARDIPLNDLNDTWAKIQEDKRSPAPKSEPKAEPKKGGG